MTALLSSMKVKWLLGALLFLIVCKPTASCGTHNERSGITVSVSHFWRVTK